MNDWVSHLLSRIKRLLRLTSEESLIPVRRLIHEFHTDQVSLYCFEDDDIPGLVHFWSVNHHGDDSIGEGEIERFFICVINLSKLRQDLGEWNLIGYLDAKHPRGIAKTLKEQLQQQASISASHFWITGWARRTTIQVIAGDLPHKKVSDRWKPYAIQLLACDLQGIGGFYFGDRYAVRFANKSAVRLAKGVDLRRPALRYQEWKFAIIAIDWKLWLTQYAQSANGIAEDHALQPRKVRITPHI